MLPELHEKSRDRSQGPGNQLTSWIEAACHFASSTWGKVCCPPAVGVHSSIRMPACELFNPLQCALLQSPPNNGFLDKTLAVLKDLSEYEGFLYGEELELEDENETEIWDSDEDEVAEAGWKALQSGTSR